MIEHPQALFIVETLAKSGYIAYFAGGWVRDYLLDHPSDDIDIATNAPPEVIQSLFPKTVPIGIAFGIVLVIVDGHEFEVATFRSDFDYKDGRRPDRIEFTTAQEDAKRRDFTINGMFYDPLKKEIHDYVGGKTDLEKKVLRAIGDPHQRIKEDRLRMIRAIRLSCRFHFTIDETTQKAIQAHAKELFPSVAIERVVQELEKGHISNKLRPMLLKLHEFGLLAAIFPTLESISSAELERRIDPIRHYPHKAPLIAFLLELFPNSSLKEQLSLCKTLKLPTHQTHFVQFLAQAKELFKKDAPTNHEWAYFYANPFSPIVLPILAAPFAENEREDFIADQEKKIGHLQKLITRIQTSEPLIKAEDLLKEGITPGINMGVLLKLAEKIAMNDLIEDKKEVLEKLKQRPEWPLF